MEIDEGEAFPRLRLAVAVQEGGDGRDGVVRRRRMIRWEKRGIGESFKNLREDTLAEGRTRDDMGIYDG